LPAVVLLVGAFLQCASLKAIGQRGDATLLQRRLANGLQAVVVRSPSAELAAVDVWIRAGSSMERDGEHGAAHFLEHMLFKGTATRPAGSIDFAVESCGGLLNAGTTRDAAHVFTTVDPAFVSEVLKVIADAIRNPLLDPRELELERSVILDELARDLHRTSRLLQDAAFAQAYADGPYAHPILGRPEDIRSISRDAVRAFHDRCYAPNRCVVVVAGNVQPDTVFAAIEGTFGDWKSIPQSEAAAHRGSNGMRTPQLATFGPIAAPSLADEPPRQMILWRIPPASDTLQVLTADLTAAILEDALPPSGDMDAAGVETAHGMEGGLIIARYPAASADTRRKIASFADRLATSGPEPDALDAARRRVFGRHLFAMETVGGMAREVGTWASYGNPQVPLDLQRFLDAVKPQTVQEFVRKWLTPVSAGSETERNR
jgi:zinc protease